MKIGAYGWSISISCVFSARIQIHAFVQTCEACELGQLSGYFDQDFIKIAGKVLGYIRAHVAFQV
jgi:hypothetical protein